MGTIYCAPLDTDLFIFCYERDFMLPISDNNQIYVIEALNSTFRPRGYKTLFMLNSAERKIYHAHKC